MIFDLDSTVLVLYGKQEGARIGYNPSKRSAEEEIRKINCELAAVNKTLEQRNGEVERMSQLKSQFLASMSHELRTPLNAIIGFADLLGEAVAGPLTAEQKQYVEHVRTAGRHLLQLIDDILDLSKIEAAQLELHPEDFSIDGALPEVLSMTGTWRATRT